jgi:hypothetical protein
VGRLLAPLALLAVGVWFAPSIVAKTGLRNRVARAALADLRGSVDVGGASFGWLAPVELRDVTVRDAQGRTLLTAPKITSSKSLLALIRNRSDLGAFAVEQPVAEVVCENGTTNLEDALATFLKDDGTPPAPTRPAVSLRVSGGTVTLRDGEKVTRFDAVEATVGVPAARSEPVTAKVSASAGPGKLDADLTIGDGGSAKLVAAGFPLDALAPLVKRLAPGASVAGALTADLTAAWGQDDTGRPTARAEGAASVRDFELAGPWLNGDRLKLASAELPLKIETVGKEVRVERAELKCDIGTLSAAGSFDPDEPTDRMLDKAGVKVEGDVDLAKLAARLPRLLRIREGTAVREGKLYVKLVSRASPAGAVWDGEVRTSALKAERDGKQLEWAEPLAVEFSGRVPPGHLPTFDTFVCRSDFAAVNAQGSAESFRAAANVYLDRLAARLGEFIDLGGVQLAGEASAWVVASRSPQGAFKADAGVTLKSFLLADRDRHGLAEKLLTLKASAAGTWVAHGPVRVETGSAGLVIGDDTLDAQLLEPVPDAKKAAGATLAVKLGGDLGRWAARVRDVAPFPPYQFGGATTARGTARVAADAVRVDDLVIGIQQARFRGAGLDINEPFMNGAAALVFTRATGTAEFTNVRITSPTLNVTEGKLVFEFPADGHAAVGGAGNAVGDLNGLARTLQLQSDPSGGDAMHGRATGPIRFRWQGDTTTFGGTLDVKDYAYGPRAKPTWAEPVMKLDLDAKYDLTPGRLTMLRGRLERPGAAVEAKGTWANFDTTQDVNVSGTVAYDLALLTPELRKAVGGGFQAAGKGSRPFAVAGSLAPGGAVTAKVGPPPNPYGKLTADAAVGWEAVTAYGFDMGPGEMRVKLANGVGTVSPVKATFGGGQITVTPAVRLDPAPGEVSFAKGKLVDRAKLTPAVCASALGYALPVIANAAQADGEISVVLDDNRVPLADVTRATAKGQIVVHKAAVGAGPVVTEIVKLLGEPSARVVLANEMTVPVRVEGGRVYHENLALTVNGYVLKTTGSVGFDGSLALVADVPIPGTFPGLKNNPALKKALAGKVVKVPVAGTMAKPAIDAQQFQAAVAALTRGAVKDAGQDFLKKELGKGLDKLFPGMPLPKK